MAIAQSSTKAISNQANADGAELEAKESTVAAQPSHVASILSAMRSVTCFMMTAIAKLKKASPTGSPGASALRSKHHRINTIDLEIGVLHHVLEEDQRMLRNACDRSFTMGSVQEGLNMCWCNPHAIHCLQKKRAASGPSANSP